MSTKSSSFSAQSLKDRLEVIKLDLAGLKLIQPRLFPDERGYFLESFRKDLYQEMGLPEFVQDNHAFSGQNTLRGLHFQKGQGQAKLVTVVQGEIFDVAVDIRLKSRTFGKWQRVLLNDRTCQQFFIPEGFAHGYLVLSKTAHVMYKVSTYYDAEKESGFSWQDPTVGIDWPLQDQKPILSLKDQNSLSFQEVFAC